MHWSASLHTRLHCFNRKHSCRQTAAAPSTTPDELPVRTSRALKLALLHAAKASALLALCRAATARTPRVLCYHGGSLGDEHEFNGKLFMRSETFSARVDWLRSKGFRPTGLHELVDALQGRKRIAAKSIAITFDDGWYSTATCLLPHLQRFGYGSTLYLATKVFEEGSPVLDVAVNYLVWRTRLEEVRFFGISHRLDGVWGLRSKAERQQAAQAMLSHLQDQQGDASSLEGTLRQLAVAMEIPPSVLALESRRFHYVNQEELLTLARAGTQVELHGHIHRYPLGQPEALRDDVQACRKRIVELGLPRPRHYCYPSGEFDEHAPFVLQAIGVESATTCLGSSPRRSVNAANLHALPRFLDGEDVDMIEFEAEMSGLLHLLRGWRERFSRSVG